MGMFFQSIAFRRPRDKSWEILRYKLRKLLERYGVDPDRAHMDREQESYGICSEEELDAMSLPELAREISALTGDYAAGAVVIDSDFAAVVLALDGEEADMGYIGQPYDTEESMLPDPARWLPLLRDPAGKEELTKSLVSWDFVLVEDQLRTLGDLTGLPLADIDALFEEDEDDFFDEDEDDF